MTTGKGWHGDKRGHREAAVKGAASSKYEYHRRIASLKLEFLRTWEDDRDLVHGGWFIAHASLALFWGFLALWVAGFQAFGHMVGWLWARFPFCPPRGDNDA